MKGDPRVYFSCLASYNAGRLFGVWVDLFEGITAEDIQLAIDYMLHKSPVEDAEEWRIDDSEGFADINPPTDLERLATLANLIHEHGEGIIKGYLAHQGNDADLDELEDYYIGTYKSEADFCQEHFDIAEAAKKIRVFDWATLDQYIDWEAIANDAFINSYYSHQESYEVVHVYTR
ncbi:MAG: antirestriction protein ArdA [Scytolyngbya sp. HA4215-MV1]|nr:antirestriction protein ArdA [Scytolyngbya sp. HA4215-MV1]